MSSKRLVAFAGLSLCLSPSCSSPSGTSSGSWTRAGYRERSCASDSDESTNPDCGLDKSTAVAG
jgi:hypothetical protein